ncbi:hypothetical protein EIP91_009544 [Steccherinum ochraceum]|uniref:Pyridoxine biosynthesis protein n=1 Tax=Steccherinum ochraceum TaxID=92696 RepID=A0A4R0R466_9APHY|nr:hypothetical protein EIP91_009544 [Steccherinum ochraceum]
MSSRRAAVVLSRNVASRRCLHATATRRAITGLHMPALSPTMTEGGISNWKKKEGDSFSAGDVLLEIETDKATLEVDAQEDGVLAKILVSDGAKGIEVGSPIALLAEEGDDISNIDVSKYASPEPTPSSSSTSKPAESQPQQSSPPPPPTPSKSASTSDAAPHSQVHPTSSRPLFPSVLRILAENGISEADKIKGTGVRGMVTKGDVLAYLGKASGPLGTYKALMDKEAKAKTEGQKTGSAKVEKKPEPLDGPSLRRAIVTSMLEASVKARNPPAPKVPLDFDSVLADYLPKSSKPTSPSIPPSLPPKTAQSSSNFLDGLF